MYKRIKNFEIIVSKKIDFISSKCKTVIVEETCFWTVYTRFYNYRKSCFGDVCVVPFVWKLITVLLNVTLILLAVEVGQMWATRRSIWQ